MSTPPFDVTTIHEALNSNSFTTNVDKEELKPLMDEERYEELPENLGVHFSVLQKVAREYDEQKLRDVIENGEVPPVELTRQEMEVVRGGKVTGGGGFFEAVAYAVGYVHAQAEDAVDSIVDSRQGAGHQD